MDNKETIREAMAAAMGTEADLDRMLEKTDRLLVNLLTIADTTTDLDATLVKTERILRNLKAIAES